MIITLYSVTVKHKTRAFRESIEHESAERKLHRETYEHMFSTLRKWSWIIIIVRTIFGILGAFSRALGWIECQPGGNEWILVDESGKFMIMGHVIALMLVAVMSKTLFGTASIASGLLKMKIRDKIKDRIDEKIADRLEHIHEHQEKEKEKGKATIEKEPTRDLENNADIAVTPKASGEK